MIGINIYDNPQRRSRRRRLYCHCTARVPATGGAISISGQIPSMPIGMRNTATAYWLLTCLRPTSLLGLRVISYSITTCFESCLPFACPSSRPSLYWSDSDEPVLSFPSPASLDAIVGHSFDGPNTVRALPPISYILAFLDHAAEGSLSAALPPHVKPPLVICRSRW